MGRFLDTFSIDFHGPYFTDSKSNKYILLCIRLRLQNFVIFGTLKLVSRRLKLVNNVSKKHVQIPKHTFLSPIITCRLLKMLKGNYKVTVFTSHSEQHIYPSVETRSPNSTQQTVLFEPTAPQSYLSSTE